jgi:hypothetical protein
MGGTGLGGLPHALVEGADRQVAVHVGARRGGDEEVEVAQDERGLGEDGEGVAGLAERLDDAAGEVVAPLGALIGVGVGAHGDVLTVPARWAELGAHPLHGVHLHHQFSLEVLADAESEVLVGGTGETVDARVAAPPVGVDGEPERHVWRSGHLVDHATGVDVEELETAVLTDPDVAVDELFLGEEHGLAAVVIGPPPPERHGLGHGAMLSNIRS